MPSSRILIASNTLSTSAASVTFSSIPSTYTDLVLKASIRSDRATYYAQVNIFPNSGAATDNSYTYIYTAAGAAYSTYQQTTGNPYGIFAGWMPGANQTSNTFNSLELYLPNYTSSTKKPMSIFSVTEQNSASSDVEIDAFAGLYNQTTSISSIKIQPYNSGTINFVSGSTFWLYGLKNS